jgi:hypothetical protein
LERLETVTPGQVVKWPLRMARIQVLLDGLKQHAWRYRSSSVRAVTGGGYDSGSGIVQIWFGSEVYFPEAVGCTVSDDDGYPLMEYRDVGFGESYLASLVAE